MDPFSVGGFKEWVSSKHQNKGISLGRMVFRNCYGPNRIVSTQFLLLYSPGRCVHSFSVLVVNSTCVSLSWSLLDNSYVPLFMVVQWSPQRQQDSDYHNGRSGKTWARLPYTDHPIYLRGNGTSSLSVLFIILFFSVKSEYIYSANII